MSDLLSKSLNLLFINILCPAAIHAQRLLVILCRDLVDRVKKDFDINFREIDPTDYGQENEFDVVTSFDVIEHMEDDVGYLNELIRITRFGGLLIIGTPNKNRLSNKLTSMLKGNIEYPRCLGYHYESGGDIIHIREYTRESLIKLVSNFENLKILNFYSCFFGLYVFGKSLGFKNVNVKILKDYSQHLFIILKKVNISR
jgi:SAM-dependent methyltransferase